MTAWSYSYLQAFETCPRRFKLTRIDKTVQEAQTEATIHGNEVHKALELAVKGDAPLPQKYDKYIPIVDLVRRTEGAKHTEQKFGLTRSFQPTRFFADNVWFRGVIDLNIIRKKTAITLDWKTGKPKSDGDQLKLFAATTFALHPHVETVHTGYAWLAYNQLDTKKFVRADVPAIWQEFLPRVERIDKAAVNNDYPPRPSGLCKNWCPVKRNLCEFSGKQ